jgi:hypothetical protein
MQANVDGMTSFFIFGKMPGTMRTIFSALQSAPAKPFLHANRFRRHRRETIQKRGAWRIETTTQCLRRR